MTGRLVNLALGLAGLGVLLTGCALGYSVDRTGASDEQVRQDWGLCGGNFSRNGSKWITAGEEDLVFSCMRDKGYSVGVTRPVLDPRLPPIPLLGE